MSKKARIQQAKLSAMESEFQILLPQCLAECAKGRWGLFGQNALADPEDRYWTWPEANHLAERLLELCGAEKSNAEGEPKLALRFLEEMQERS